MHAGASRARACGRCGIQPTCVRHSSSAATRTPFPALPPRWSYSNSECCVPRCPSTRTAMVDPTGFVEGDRPPHASLHTPAQRIACPAAHSGAGWTAIRAATVAVAVAVALSGVPRAAAADNALLKKIGNAWTSGTLSWCMAASMKLSDIKKLRSDSEGMTGPELAVAKEKPCKQHIDDWCELRFGDSKDVCKRTYLALMPVGDNLSAGPGASECYPHPRRRAVGSHSLTPSLLSSARPFSSMKARALILFSSWSCWAAGMEPRPNSKPVGHDIL